MHLTWTTWNDTDSVVEYGENPSDLDKIARGRSDVFIDGGNEQRKQFIHKVEIGNLKPNATYCNFICLLDLLNYVIFNS